jgi:hypothetical protein
MRTPLGFDPSRLRRVSPVRGDKENPSVTNVTSPLLGIDPSVTDVTSPLLGEIGFPTTDSGMTPQRGLRLLDREIHGLLVDMGMLEQRMDEFVDQEALVERFLKAWVKIVEGIEKDVIKQVESGKTKVKV